MIESVEDRARAVECLLMAERARNKHEKQRWLSLAESWLQIAHVRRVSARSNAHDAAPARDRNARTSSAANWHLRYAAVLGLGTGFLIGVWIMIRSHYVG
jgi:hypothetical protein